MDSLVDPRPTNRTSEFVDKLNLGYNLDLQVPVLPLPPKKRWEAQRTEEDALVEHIETLIHQLSSKCPDVLPGIERQFNQEARAICGNWVSKPRAAPDLLPVTDALPRASSAVERRQLRECLLAILKPYGLSYGNRGRAQNQQSQRPGHRKRISDESPQELDSGHTIPHVSPNKKVKEAVDHVPVRVTLSPSNGPIEKGAIPANRSFEFRDNLAVAHPPPYHSFGGPAPKAPHALNPHQSARSPAPHCFTRATPAATRSFDYSIVNQESANTSITTHHSAIFSFPPPDDNNSVSSQTTIPNDDREEYKDAGLSFDAALYRPDTPTRPDGVESAANPRDGAVLDFTPPPFTSSEEDALITLDPTTSKGCGVDIDGTLGIQGGELEDLVLNDALPRGLNANAAPSCTETTIPIRQRDSISPVPTVSSTGSTYWSADLDHHLPIYGRPPISDGPSIHRQPLPLEYRLINSWPKLPGFLVNAPLPVIWEVTRAALHCGVPLEDFHMEYDDSWHDLTLLRKALATHHDFRGKVLPDRCDDRAWRAAFSASLYDGLSVTLAIEASYNHEKDGPLYSFNFQPLKLESSHRLARRFGADRFLEVIIPSPTGRDKPRGLKADDLIGLLSQSDHILLGRLWRSFFTKDDKKDEKQEVFTRTEIKTLSQERLYLFATDGNEFMASISRTIPTKEEITRTDSRTKMKVNDLLEWAISMSRNGKQPILKLFSRIALSLSRTTPTVVLEKHQIKAHNEDLISPTGNIMNDGIGRMSPSLAKMITKRLGLDDQEMPSGFQGRIGPYKGFWVIDYFDDGEIWIEGYPSQKKWECDMDDADHRTFEVKAMAQRLTPGALNEQFIPILEDRALEKRPRMKEAIKMLLEETVNKDLEEQTHAAEDPVTLHAWAHQNASATRGEKIASRQVPFLGGLPKSDEEILKVLLDAGFDPKLRYIRELTEKLVRERCERLKEKMKITVPRSAYAFMTVDFSGVLEEGEVHLAFSRGSECDTRAPDGISRNELHGHDVLVARVPAHFPSDIQKVRAVFKPELRHLQNVIVFSIKGNVPLADMLSGGDYDGDKAWVCWDPSIVDNFTNAPVPKQPDLFKKYEGDSEGYLAKDRRTFEEILRFRCDGDVGAAGSEFLKDSFLFNMQPPLLGACTVYKEKVCYKTGLVGDEKAVILSTLVSHLVDQAKQGIIFPYDEFRRLKNDLIKVFFNDGEEPAYKGERYSGSGTPRHILDWLKFVVAKPLIEKGLKRFTEAISGGKDATKWDPDLAYYYEDLERLAENSASYSELRRILHKDINDVLARWNKDGFASYQAKVYTVYNMWVAIRPSKKALKKEPLRMKLLGPQDAPDSISYWGRLKASVTFFTCYRLNPGFVWRIAGAYLAAIKAEMHSARTGRPAFAVVPGMYVVHRPDRKMVRALTAKDESAVGFESDVEEMDEV